MASNNNKRKAAPVPRTTRKTRRTVVPSLSEPLSALQAVIEARLGVGLDSSDPLSADGQAEVDQTVDAIQQLASFLKAADPHNAKQRGRDLVNFMKTCFEIEDEVREGIKPENDDKSHNDDVEGQDDEKLDDEICVVGGARLMESETICPVTKKAMENPIKNAHPTNGCKHRMESTSLDALVTATRLVARCPVQHCPGQWERCHVVMDTEFAARLKQLSSKKKSKASSKPIDVIDLT